MIRTWTIAVAVAVAMAVACGDAVAQDIYGDALPAHAIARLGTIRLRHATSPSNGVAFSKDGKMVVTGGLDGYFSVWDRHSGKLIARLGSGPDRFITCAFSPDGKEVLTVSQYRPEVHRWNIASGKKTVNALPKNFRATAAAFSPDGSALAVHCRMESTMVLPTSPALGKPIEFDANGLWIREMALSASSGKLAARTNKDVRVWDVTGGKMIGKVPAGSRSPKAMALTPDGKELCVGWSTFRRSTAVLYDSATLKETRRASFPSAIYRLAVSPNGKVIACGWPGSATLYELETRKKISVCEGGEQVIFSPDSKMIAVSSIASHVNYALRLWNVETGKEEPKFAAHACGIVGMGVSADGKTVATLDDSGYIFDWDLATARPTMRGKKLIGGTSLALTPDGRRVAAATSLSVYLGDLSGKTELKSVDGAGGFIKQAKFSPDGRLLVVGSERGVCGFDAESGKELFRVKFAEGVPCLAVSPDSKTVACCDDQDIMHLLSAKDGSVLKEVKQQTLPNDRTLGSDLVYSPDGKTLVLSGGSVVCYDARTLEPREIQFDTKSESESGYQSIRAMAFSPDGKLLAVGSADGNILLLDPATGKLKARLAGHRGHASALAFGGANGRLYSASSDSTVLIWDIDKALIGK